MMFLFRNNDIQVCLEQSVQYRADDIIVDMVDGYTDDGSILTTLSFYSLPLAEWFCLARPAMVSLSHFDRVQSCTNQA